MGRVLHCNMPVVRHEDIAYCLQFLTCEIEFTGPLYRVVDIKCRHWARVKSP